MIIKSDKQAGYYLQIRTGVIVGHKYWHYKVK